MLGYCKNCVYLLEKPKQEQMAGKYIGKCRRWPPQALGGTQTVEQPPVEPYDACGEFKPKNSMVDE